MRPLLILGINAHERDKHRLDSARLIFPAHITFQGGRGLKVLELTWKGWFFRKGPSLKAEDTAQFQLARKGRPGRATREHQDRRERDAG